MPERDPPGDHEGVVGAAESTIPSLGTQAEGTVDSEGNDDAEFEGNTRLAITPNSEMEARTALGEPRPSDVSIQGAPAQADAGRPETQIVKPRGLGIRAETGRPTLSVAGEGSMTAEGTAVRSGEASPVTTDDRAAPIVIRPDPVRLSINVPDPEVSLGTPRAGSITRISDETALQLMVVAKDLRGLQEDIVTLVEDVETEAHREWLWSIREMLAQTLEQVEEAMETRRWPPLLPGLVTAVEIQRQRLERNPVTTSLGLALGGLAAKFTLGS